MVARLVDSNISPHDGWETEEVQHRSFIVQFYRFGIARRIGSGTIGRGARLSGAVWFPIRGTT
jgi:hypothetical protein